MGWIQTYTGKRIYPRAPVPEAINISDIAHALSLLCRFNGHCVQFYSVAEHSIHVASIVSPKIRLYALLHDAAEAYLGDIPRPLKTDADRLSENRMLSCIFQSFGMEEPSIAIWKEIKYADAAMLAAEADQLMSIPPNGWEELPAPAPIAIECWAPLESEQRFLNEIASCFGMTKKEPTDA